MIDWSHAPVHRLDETGAYIVTAGTYGKAFFLANYTRRDRLMVHTFNLAAHFGWQLQAWAFMSNHYHNVASSPEDPDNLSDMINLLHHDSAVAFNKEDGTPGRKVWHQYWETHLTSTKSYYCRLRYVHENPVKHGLVENAADYRWCSRHWFDQHADSSFKRRLASFKIDQVKVFDDF